MKIERQELQCTNCCQFVRFDMDFDLDGNHEIECPECKHIHYRVVCKGKITEERWKSSAGPIYIPYNIITSYSSYTYTATTGGTGVNYYLQDLWISTGN